MNHGADQDEERRAAEVIADLQRLRGAACAGCGRTLCGHQALISRAMGFRDRPHCHHCLARQLGRGADDLRDQAHAHLMHQGCHRQGWQWADTQEGVATGTRPACLWPAHATGAPTTAARPVLPTTATAVAVDARFDAGDMGCGDLVMELRLQMQALAPGQVLELTARDPGAPADLPAWCGMTGHTLLQAIPPRYWIRRKDG